MPIELNEPEHKASQRSLKTSRLTRLYGGTSNGTEPEPEPLNYLMQLTS